MKMDNGTYAGKTTKILMDAYGHLLKDQPVTVITRTPDLYKRQFEKVNKVSVKMVEDKVFKNRFHLSLLELV